MANELGTQNSIARYDYDEQLMQFEAVLIGFLEERGLPSVNILVSVPERQVVFVNVEAVLAKVSLEQRPKSVYLSKFIAAIAAGLFDAALNYLWDQTIHELRSRVAQYDLSYFYDNAVRSTDKRAKLRDEDDLDKIDDSELIFGAKEIELISDMGFKHLDYIRYMRNWASAAHPNQNELSGLQLVSWLETCIKEVISLPLSNIAVEIKKLLNNIKSNSVSESDAKEIAPFFLELTPHQANNLASGFFGIYTKVDTTAEVRQNIQRLLPFLWERVEEATRQQFGIKYGKFTVNNDQDQKKLARQFLEIVSGQSFIPDSLRSAEIQIAIDNLLTAHRGWSNFSNEPPFARALMRLVGNDVPSQISKNYVSSLVEVFLTNGNGVSWSADTIYAQMLNQLNPDQLLLAMLSFTDDNIASKLRFPICAEKYRELLKLLSGKVVGEAAKELLRDIVAFPGPLDKMRDTMQIKRRVAAFERIMN